MRQRRPAFALGLAASLLAGAAAAQPAGEHLYLDICRQLPGWTAQPTTSNGQSEITAILPPGQTESNWTDSVAVEISYGVATKSPQQVLADEFATAQRDCDDAIAGPVSPTMANGYETALRAIECTKSKRWNRGEVDLYKALRGKEGMYVVVRAWSGQPFEKGHNPVTLETSLKWLAFMQTVVLCDTRDTQHPCPPPGPPCAPAKP